MIKLYLKPDKNDKDKNRLVPWEYRIAKYLEFIRKDIKYPDLPTKYGAIQC